MPVSKLLDTAPSSLTVGAKWRAARAWLHRAMKVAISAEIPALPFKIREKDFLVGPGHFLAIAATFMRRILVDLARSGVRDPVRAHPPMIESAAAAERQCR